MGGGQLYTRAVLPPGTPVCSSYSLNEGFIPEQSPEEINPYFKRSLTPAPTFHMNRPVVLQPATRVPLQLDHTESAAHIEPRYVPSQIHSNIVY